MKYRFVRESSIVLVHQYLCSNILSIKLAFVRVETFINAIGNSFKFYEEDYLMPLDNLCYNAINTAKRNTTGLYQSIERNTLPIGNLSNDIHCLKGLTNKEGTWRVLKYSKNTTPAL